jgi:hypothetical protein
MQRYLCPSCHEVTEPSPAARFAWCTACGQPLTLFDALSMRSPITADPDKPVPIGTAPPGTI